MTAVASRSPAAPARKQATAARKAPASVQAPAKTPAKKVAPAAAKQAATQPAKSAPVAPKVKKTAPAQAKVAAPAAPGGKQKLVRDSFTMPTPDFNLIHALKERALGFRRPTKKSELLRAGLHALSTLTDAQLRTALDGLTPLKSGRPKKAG